MFQTLVAFALLLASSYAELECGVPEVPIIQNTFGKRIVGGWEAKPHSIPWQVYVMTFSDKTRYGACGGSLVQPQNGKNGTDLVLSAAHCTYNKGVWAPSSKMKVVVGAHNIRSFDEPSKRRIPVRDYKYGSYNDRTKENDIILIRLKEVVPYTTYTRPICLPNSSEGLPVGKKCFVSGWGTTSEGGTSSELLRMVDVNVYPEEKCYLNRDMFPVMFCAGHEQGGKDSCQGDSGGPLVCQDGEKWVQYGVVSFGAGCARAGRPGVYAKVTNYIQWINQAAKELATSPDKSPGQEAESLYDGPRPGSTGSVPTKPSTQTFYDSYQPGASTDFTSLFNKPTADLFSGGSFGFQSPIFQNSGASSAFKPGGGVKPGFSNSFSGFSSGFGSGLGGKLPPGTQTTVSRDPTTGAVTTTYTYSSSSGGRLPSLGSRF